MRRVPGCLCLDVLYTNDEHLDKYKSVLYGYDMEVIVAAFSVVC